MSHGMSAPKTWSREELIAILGQPDSEKNTIGATRVMQWWCSPIPDDAEDIDQAFKALQEQPMPELNEAYAVVTRATEILDILADSCVATSVVTGNEGDRWEIWRACSKHRQAGLKGRHDDHPAAAS
jgi:hypothetical protein